MVDKDIVRTRALQLIDADGRHVAPRLVEEFKLSRQAVNNHLQALARAGLIEVAGNTRARVYRLAVTQEMSKTYAREGLRDDIPWLEVFAPAVSDLPENVRSIWHYGVTEMVNNAVDHSGASSVKVNVKRTALSTVGYVVDDGVGIFLKIQRALGLYDSSEAILELAKGKVTTDPIRHSGEGIFFTSRAFDMFGISSGKLTFVHGAAPMDVLADRLEAKSGTLVALRLENASSRRLPSVFDQFSSPETSDFSKTIVPVRLAQYEGQKLVSRSQARRLTAGFDRFRQVVLDFSDVVEIGQAFADEVFRVFAKANPKTRLTAINTASDVKRMMDRALAASAEADDRLDLTSH